MGNMIQSKDGSLFVIDWHTVAIYGLINYWTKAEVDIKRLVLNGVVLFMVYCLMVLISPHLRKVTGHKNKIIYIGL